jgi:hypothetical protein
LKFARTSERIALALNDQHRHSNPRQVRDLQPAELERVPPAGLFALETHALPKRLVAQ